MKIRPPKLPSSVEQWGEIINGRFCVHKLPSHLILIKDSFGIAESRLKDLLSRNVRECFIFYHELDGEETVTLYKTTVTDWLRGTQWENKLKSGHIELQRLISRGDCKQ